MGAAQRGFGELMICSADLCGTYQMNPLCANSSTMSSGSVHFHNCLLYFNNKCFPQAKNMQKATVAQSPVNAVSVTSQVWPLYLPKNFQSHACSASPSPCAYPHFIAEKTKVGDGKGLAKATQLVTVGQNSNPGPRPLCLSKVDHPQGKTDREPQASSDLSINHLRGPHRCTVLNVPEEGK